MTELSFYKDHTLSFLPRGLDKLTQLKHLNFSRSSVGEDELYNDGEGENEDSSDISKLFKLAKSLPNLEHLNLSSTYLGDWLDENDEKFNELKALLPNCNIEI